MSLAERNKVIVDRYREEVFNQGNLDAVDKYVGADYVRRDPSVPVDVRGREGVKQIAAAFRDGFPDEQFAAQDIVAEGDKVVLRLLFTGTHLGEFMSILPTGKQISVTVMEMFRLEDGLIVEQWVEADNLGALRQLGAIP